MKETGSYGKEIEIKSRHNFFLILRKALFTQGFLVLNSQNQYLRRLGIREEKTKRLLIS